MMVVVVDVEVNVAVVKGGALAVIGGVEIMGGAVVLTIVEVTSLVETRGAVGRAGVDLAVLVRTIVTTAADVDQLSVRRMHDIAIKTQPFLIIGDFCGRAICFEPRSIYRLKK